MRLIILGFGGHARSAADVALAIGYSNLIFIDANARPAETFLGHPVLAELSAVDIQESEIFPASGDNARRQEQLDFIASQGLTAPTLIAPTATIGTGTRLGAGTLVAHHAHVGPLAKIGQGCIINTAAIVEHDCQIGDYCHISVNTTVAGKASIGESCFIGAGAVVIDGVSIAPGVILGAGSVVTRSIEQTGTYVGAPAKRLARD
jgi:sugar O-acyltransferase (sialic acid O-acetyltransferase NeuD family)